MNTEQELTFDHADPAMEDRLHETYAEFRAKCPVAHGEKFGGFWALTRYDDILKAARDYANFTVTQGITIPHINGATPVLPAQVDPPRAHRLPAARAEVLHADGDEPVRGDRARHDTPATGHDCRRRRGRPGAGASAARSSADGDRVHVRLAARTVASIRRLGRRDDAHRVQRRRRGSRAGDRRARRTFLEERCLERRERDDDTVLAAIANGHDRRPPAHRASRSAGSPTCSRSPGTRRRSTRSARCSTTCSSPRALNDRLRADPDLLAPMVEEALRFEAPVMWMARTVVNQSELSGQTLCPATGCCSRMCRRTATSPHSTAPTVRHPPRRQPPPGVRSRYAPVPRGTPGPNRDAGRRRGDHRPHARRAVGRWLRARLASRPNRSGRADTSRRLHPVGLSTGADTDEH